jgi:hypothetical protein
MGPRKKVKEGEELLEDQEIDDLKAILLEIIQG